MRGKEKRQLTEYKVLAFHGPAGTGKSMRAQKLAASHQVDLIIDDGLIIHKGTILSGKSAKSEENMVRAIRRAMFHYPEHRKVALETLEKFGPCHIMVLATSSKMAHDICRALQLPDPYEEITIDQIATPAEMKKALYERKFHKRHVIPVGTAQIQKNFTGRLVGALKSLFGSGESEEKTIVRPPFSYFGTLQIDAGVMTTIAQHIALTTPQVCDVQELKVKGEDSLSLSMTVTLFEGEQTIKQVIQNLQRRICVAVEGFVGATVAQIKLNVGEVILIDEQHKLL